MIFAASAFLIAAFVQIAIDDSVPAVPKVGESKVIFINSGPCRVNVNPLFFDGDMKDFDVDRLNVSTLCLELQPYICSIECN